MIKNKNKNKNFSRLAGSADRGRSYLAVFNKFLFFMIIAGGVYFILSINDLSVKGFVLQELRLKSQELTKENKLAENRITELESYENIQTRALNMNLVKADKIDYITITNEAMARK